MAHHKDDPETMARMRTWLAAVAGELGLDDGLPAEAEKPVLDLISQVAHGPSRPGAPLTAFLVGVA
ncbi:molybdopterin-guanine dinucleotide biosynthesis protein, partial [Propionibacterium freudenreichii]